MENALSDRPTKYKLHFKKSAYNWLNFCKELPPCYDAGGDPIEHSEFGGIDFHDEATKRVSLLLLNGKIQFAYWVATGDDFHLAKWMFADLPIDPAGLPPGAGAEVDKLSAGIEAAMAQAVSFKLNAGKKVGNYNLAKCRHVTDISDRIFLEALGLPDVWQDIELLYAQVVKTDFSDADEGDASE